MRIAVRNRYRNRLPGERCRHKLRPVNTRVWLARLGGFGGRNSRNPLVINATLSKVFTTTGYFDTLPVAVTRGGGCSGSTRRICSKTI